MINASDSFRWPRFLATTRHGGVSRATCEAWGLLFVPRVNKDLGIHLAEVGAERLAPAALDEGHRVQPGPRRLVAMAPDLPVPERAARESLVERVLVASLLGARRVVGVEGDEVRGQLLKASDGGADLSVAQAVQPLHVRGRDDGFCIDALGVRPLAVIRR